MRIDIKRAIARWVMAVQLLVWRPSPDLDQVLQFVAEHECTSAREIASHHGVDFPAVLRVMHLAARAGLLEEQPTYIGKGRSETSPDEQLHALLERGARHLLRTRSLTGWLEAHTAHPREIPGRLTKLFELEFISIIADLTVLFIHQDQLERRLLTGLCIVTLATAAMRVLTRKLKRAPSAAEKLGGECVEAFRGQLRVMVVDSVRAVVREHEEANATTRLDLIVCGLSSHAHDSVGVEREALKKVAQYLEILYLTRAGDTFDRAVLEGACPLQLVEVLLAF